MQTKTEPIAYWEAVQQLVAAVKAAEVTTIEIEQALAALESPELAQHMHAVAVRELIAQMSDLSEDAYCAGWLHDNEHYLWECAQHPGVAYGAAPLDLDTIALLQTAAQTLGGWVRWVGAPMYHAVFIPLAEWELLHTAWVAANERERAIIATLQKTRPELFTWPDPVEPA